MEINKSKTGCMKESKGEKERKKEKRTGKDRKDK